MTAEKIEAFWENATADDVELVMNGETVEARFRDVKTEPWSDCYTLTGWVNELRHQWRSAEAGGRWNFCQVYREPSWYAERPDPGPGYRLLGKFPDEKLKPGDEGWDMRNDKQWRQSDNANLGTPQSEGIWYRRRIEAVEPKFAVGQMVRVVGPKGSDAKHWSEGMNKHLGKESAVRHRENKDAAWFYELGCSAIWAFREDYLEVVEPRPQHYVLRVGDAVETPSGHLIKAISPDVAQIHYALKVGDTISTPNGQTITITAKGFEVTQ